MKKLNIIKSPTITQPTYVTRKSPSDSNFTLEVVSQGEGLVAFEEDTKDYEIIEVIMDLFPNSTHIIFKTPNGSTGYEEKTDAQIEIAMEYLKGLR